MSNVRASSPGPVPPGRRPGTDRRADRHAEVPSITSAPEPLADDQARRTRRYLIQMGVRLVFFGAAVGIFMTDAAPRWVMWTLIVCAAVLPYSAVLFANAGRDRVSYDTSPVTDPARAELPAAASGGPTPADGETGRVVHEDGRVVDHPDDAGPRSDDPREGASSARTAAHDPDDVDDADTEER